jgi:Kef-type K+ transport system membrane component KefB
MKKETTRIQELETLAVLALFFLLLGMATGRWLFVCLAIILLVTALFAKPVARLLTKWWLRFAEMTAAINSRVLLTIIYYGVLTPVAFLYRFFHKDHLFLKRNDRDSFYFERNHTYSGEDLEKMW